MLEEDLAVEANPSTAAEMEGVETSQNAPTDETVEVDYASLLEELERTQRDRDNYKKGLLKAKGKIQEDQPEFEEKPEVDIDKLVEEKLNQKLSSLQGNFTKNIVQNTLADVSQNASEQKLIQWYYENKIIKSGMDPESVRNDLEDCKAMVNKKKVLQTQNELKVALRNKSQISTMPNSGISEKTPVTSQYFSADQLADFKKRGWNDEKIKKAEENMRKIANRPPTFQS